MFALALSRDTFVKAVAQRSTNSGHSTDLQMHRLHDIKLFMEVFDVSSCRRISCRMIIAYLAAQT